MSITLASQQVCAGNARTGFTLIEIVMASLIGGVLAGGTMIAFLRASRLAQGSSNTVEATSLAQQTVERFRNKIACRQPDEGSGQTWYDESCAPAVPSGPQDDELPEGALGGRGTRTYEVISGPDFITVKTRVEWEEPQ